jgi:hypothetical protein
MLEQSRRISLRLRLCGGGDSLDKLFSAEFPANREKYREFRVFYIEFHRSLLVSISFNAICCLKGSKLNREFFRTYQGISSRVIDWNRELFQNLMVLRTFTQVAIPENRAVCVVPPNSRADGSSIS